MGLLSNWFTDDEKITKEWLADREKNIKIFEKYTASFRDKERKAWSLGLNSKTFLLLNLASWKEPELTLFVS